MKKKEWYQRCIVFIVLFVFNVIIYTYSVGSYAQPPIPARAFIVNQRVNIEDERIIDSLNNVIYKKLKLTSEQTMKIKALFDTIKIQWKSFLAYPRKVKEKEKEGYRLNEIKIKALKDIVGDRNYNKYVKLFCKEFYCK